MKYRIELTDPEDESYVRRCADWCRRWQDSLNGFYYDDPLAGPDGIHLRLLVPESRNLKTHIQAALREAKRSRDVVSHSVMIVPDAWVQPEGAEV